RASRSASTSAAPCSTSIRPTVLLPLPMPPVRPMSRMGRHFMPASHRRLLQSRLDMKGLRRLAAVVLPASAVVLLASCGGSSDPSYPTIHFVGNDTCPTASASPYNPIPPRVNGDKVVGQAVDEMPHIH